MSTILFLKFRTPSHWHSCHELLNELEVCYRQTFAQLNVIEIDLDELSWETAAVEMASLKPDMIIFADHRLRIPLWVHLIKARLEKNVSWVIHTYGCFTGRVDEWLQLTQLIPNDEVKFLAGSDTHADIIRHFFQNSQIVETFAFPYLSETVEHSRRAEIRKRYQLQDADMVFTYAGRISYQKNVHHLIKLLNELKPVDKTFKLFIAGLPDDKNPRELPYAYYLNHAAELVQQELANSKIQVTYLNQLSTQELEDLYLASDYAVSLSTLYGEDYGRSLIEGLSTGAGVIATRWGGHKDLASLSQVSLIDVVLENETLKIDLDQFALALQAVKHQDRNKNCQSFETKFGKTQAIQKLKQCLSSFHLLGGISREAVLFDLKENTPWKGKEFFNLHEKVLLPYWK